MENLLDKLRATNFTYTGSNLTEKEVISNGHLQLLGEELLVRISNKTVFGDYPMGYKFVSKIYENGMVNGINNVGTVDSGNWSIDFVNHILQLEWKNAWIDTLTRAYDVNGNIEFFDIDSGNWRTTFKIIESLKTK